MADSPSRAAVLSLRLGVPLALLVYVFGRWLAAWSHEASATAAVTALCALWWIFEPIAIPATSIIPFAALPLLGVLDAKVVATAYGDSLILLLLGGFMLSTAIEKSGVHRRLALGMVRAFGGKSRRRLVLGFMVASAVCSMWISNTATVLMLLPIVLAVIEQDDDGTLAMPLLLGVAYAASVGGIGTPIGTPPNVICIRSFNESFDPDFDFLSWMAIGLPIVLCVLPVLWIWLVRKLPKGHPLEVPTCGAWRRPERRVLVVFVLTAAAWCFLKQPAGGWSGLLEFAPDPGELIGPPPPPSPVGPDLATVALVACMVLFLCPDGEGGRLLDWDHAKKVPWGLLLLFGGGIAIAKGFAASGLSHELGQAFAPLSTWPRFPMILAICIAVTFLTEVTSNTATTNILMPILVVAAIAAEMDARLLMIPAAASASCAFMLPVATAPNAVIFGSGHVPVREMIRHGFALNLIVAFVVATLCWTLL